MLWESNVCVRHARAYVSPSGATGGRFGPLVVASMNSSLDAAGRPALTSPSPRQWLPALFEPEVVRLSTSIQFASIPAKV